MPNIEIPPRPSVEEQAQSAIARGGLRDRRAPQITGPPYSGLGAGLENEDHQAFEIDTAAVWVVLGAVVTVMGVTLWVLW